jgi:ribonuclease-3
LDELSRKEVNFKSKLIEWSQKNKIKTSFELIEQFFDDKSELIFQTEILLEGVSAGIGLGYSKKESQQNAAQIALKKIKKSRDFVLSVLEAKKKKEIRKEASPENSTRQEL